MRFIGRKLCLTCRRLSSCPANTKVYANYCGAGNSLIEEKVEHAVAECRRRNPAVVLAWVGWDEPRAMSRNAGAGMHVRRHRIAHRAPRPFTPAGEVGIAQRR
jgi:hypothetical protein